MASSPRVALFLDHNPTRTFQHSTYSELLMDGPERPPPSPRRATPIDVCSLLNRDSLVYLLRKKKLLCQTLLRMDREGKHVMSLGQFRQALHASDSLVYLDILSPSWKIFVANNDPLAAKVDIERLITVLDHGESDSSILRSMTQVQHAGGSKATPSTSSANPRAIPRVLVQPPRSLQDHSALPNTICSIIRTWRAAIGPIRLQLQPQLQIHDAPLSLADLTRIAIDGGARIVDDDYQILQSFGHLEMPCSKWFDFICSEDISLELDAKRLKQIKQRLAAVVYKPVFISRVQHLPSFKDGIVPLDSLIRVLLSSSEFEPRFTSDDLRVLVAGLQPFIHTHSYSHGGGERVIDWTGVMSSLLQDMKDEQNRITNQAADCSSSVAVVVNGEPSLFHQEMNADPNKHILKLHRSKDERRHLKESKFTLYPDSNDQFETAGAVSDRVIAMIQKAVKGRGIQYKSTFDDMTGGRGNVGAQQLQQSLQQQGCNLTRADAAAIVQHFDSDNDGLMTFADFTRLMQTPCDSVSSASGNEDEMQPTHPPRPFMAKAYMTNARGFDEQDSNSGRGPRSSLDPQAALRFGKAFESSVLANDKGNNGYVRGSFESAGPFGSRHVGGGSISARGFERQDRLTFNMLDQAEEKGFATARRNNSMKRDYEQARAVVQRLREMDSQQQHRAEERLNSFRLQQQRYNDAAERENEFAQKYQRKHGTNE